MHPLPFGLFGDIGGPELFVVFAAILLLFGGKRLPSIARQIGRMAEDLRRASQEFKDQLLRADDELNDAASGRPSSDDRDASPTLPPSGPVSKETATTPTPDTRQPRGSPP